MAGTGAGTDPGVDAELDAGLDAGLDVVLRDAGLRATRPRATVLGVLRAAQAAGEHLPAAAVAGRARSLLGSLSTQAVYDCLDALVSAGLARRIRPADAASAVYEARVGDNHHHLVCRGCGLTTDVDCAAGTAPCLAPSSPPPGFVVDEAELTFWGWCAACATVPAQLPKTRNPQEENR
jgi:Fur family transcriptional regulator, stress-responsive regulator